MEIIEYNFISQSFGDTSFSPYDVIWVTWVCDTSNIWLLIWVLSIFELIRLSRYCVAIRERNSCLYRICKKNIFCSKYMLKDTRTYKLYADDDLISCLW